MIFCKLRSDKGCTLLLETPAGTAVAAAPSEGMLASTEDCAAKATLVAASGSVAAYDKVPLAAASCLFTMDTATNIFLMHSFQVGSLLQLW